MESEKESKDEGQKNGCHSKKHCCCGKAIMAIALLLIGGIIGYLCGSHCSMYKNMCSMEKMKSNCPITQPAQEAAQPAK